MATLKDISELTKLSTATISRILNGDSTLSVTDSTRNKVIDAARTVGYKKKQRSGKQHSNFTIGIIQWFSIQQEIEDSYYLYIRHGIEDFCVQNNINIIRSQKNDFPYIDTLKDCDFIICIGKFSNGEIKKIKKISQKLLFIDMDVEDDSVSTITLDYKTAVNDALELLSSKGGSIGFLGGKEYLDDKTLVQDMRKIYFEEFCQQRELNYKQYTLVDRFSTKSGYDMMLSLIRSKKVPDNIFAASDPIAIGAMRALYERGYSVPEDVSIIGFDDTDASNYTSPALTTIHAPAYNMGNIGANIAYNILSQKNASPMKIKLPCSLVIRNSCRS